MNLHLFNNRAYIINTPSLKDSSVKFVKAILDKLNYVIDIKQLESFDNALDYDTYSIKAKDGKFYLLKVSFDSSNKSLKKESKILKQLKGFACGKFIAFDKIKISEEIVCLLMQFPDSLCFDSLGRSFVIENSEILFKTHKHLCENLKVKSSKTNYLKESFEEFNFPKFLDKKTKAAIDSYSDYKLFEKIYKDLVKDLKAHVPKTLKHKPCLGNMNISSIFLKENLIFFDKLEKCSNFHPLIDLCELILTLGLKDKQKNKLIKSFILVYNDVNAVAFNEFFNFSIRKKLLENMCIYLREVYYLNFFRAEKVTDNINVFYTNFKHFNKIPIFLDNKEFLVKSLTEPVLGAKA